MRLVSLDDDRFGPLAVVSVDVARASAGGDFNWRLLSTRRLVGDAINEAEPKPQHRDQISGSI